MRTLELILILLVLVTGILRIVYAGRPSPGWFRYVLWSMGGILMAHLLWDGWRLQMLPVYLAAAGIAAFGNRRVGRAMGLLIGGCAAIAAAVSGIGAYKYPVFILPTPQGPYRIGTFTAHLVDHDRHERHAASPNAPREFMIQVWYPAGGAGGVRAKYRDPRMNTWRSNHLRLIKTHSYSDLPLADQPARFPVLLFSPSSGGNRDQNTFEVEELASQGYVVVGMDHPYSSSRVVFPDGHVASSLPWINSATKETFEATEQRVELMVQDHVSDVRFLLDEMALWNQPNSGHRLASRLDLTKVGVIGHSFGGALAAAVCLVEPRIAAGINMDGWMFGKADTEGIPKPFFFMYSGNGKAPDLSNAASLSTPNRVVLEKDSENWQSAQNTLHRFGGYFLTILGAEHFSYSDLILFQRPMAILGEKVRDPYRDFQITNAFTLAFFDRYIRGKPAPLLDNGGFAGEVLYEKYPAAKITAVPAAIHPMGLLQPIASAN